MPHPRRQRLQGLLQGLLLRLRLRRLELVAVQWTTALKSSQPNTNA